MIEWIKEHPYLSGGLAFVVVVLFVVLRNRSNSSSATPLVYQNGPSDAISALSIQSGAAVQAAQLQMQGQIAGYNAAVNETQLTTAAQTTQTQIAGGVQLQQILSAADVQNHSTDAALTLGLANLGFSPVLPPGSVGLIPPQPVTVGIGSQSSAGSANATGQQGQINTALNSNPYPQTNPSINYGTVGEPTLNAQGQVVIAPGVETNVVGNTPYAGFTLPSSAGMSWQQYVNAIDAIHPSPTNPMDFGAVGQENAIFAAAQQEYITDPLSCHNSTTGACAA